MNYTTNVGERGVATEETERLIASDKVEGTAVFDRGGDHIGRVHHLMIDKHSGQVAYAVTSFGGFLGIGESWIPLPWKALTYEPRVNGYVVAVDRAKLRDAPNYASNADPDWADQKYRREIDHYWFPPL